jgi:hypothetical protein
MGYAGHVKNGVVVFDEPVALPEGASVRVEIVPTDEEAGERDWPEGPVASFAEDWDNEQDAVYDNWREQYGVRDR